MGADQHGSGEDDRISSLPNELLHDILVRLDCAYAAARTSVLSRRWRRVWTHLPELRLDRRRAATSVSFVDSVDAALAGYSAPTLDRLSIYLSLNSINHIFRIPAGRIAPWLHFAAAHVVGELSLHVPVQRSPYTESEAVIKLPVCERAKRIQLYFIFVPRLRLIQAYGQFVALTFLELSGSLCMDGKDLTALVSTQCPCLRDLQLFLQLIALSDISVHSNSLHRLVLRVFDTRRLEVVAPRLEELMVHHPPMEAHISTPKLLKVAWDTYYDPHVHRFVHAGRTLRLLKTSYLASSLTKSFDEVDELELEIDLSSGNVANYGRFLSETNKLPKCKSFSVVLYWKYHALMPIMLHLLRSCNGVEKFSVNLFDGGTQPVRPCCPLSCPCRLEKCHNIDSPILNSLEEVQISGFTDSLEDMELVEFLSSNAVNLKRLVIKCMRCPPRPITKEVCGKILSMCHRNVDVKFHVFRDGRFMCVS